MTTKVMVDLETLGKEPGSIVLAIGAVAFDMDTRYVGAEETGHQFSTYLDPISQQNAGLKIDANTVLWWMDQAEEARQAIVQATKHPFHLALVSFSEWLEFVCGEDLEEVDYLDVEIWGNGANFDAPMLRALYKAAGVRCPWGFWSESCHRTTRRRLHQRYKDLGEPEFQGERHNALHDAVHQANVLGSLTLQSRTAPIRDTKG